MSSLRAAADGFFEHSDVGTQEIARSTKATLSNRFIFSTKLSVSEFREADCEFNNGGGSVLRYRNGATRGILMRICHQIEWKFGIGSNQNQTISIETQNEESRRFPVVQLRSLQNGEKETNKI